MHLDSTILSVLIGIAAGAIGAMLSYLIASTKTSHELENQDIRIESAIARLSERYGDTREDLKELDREFLGKISLLEQRLDDSDRKFRSLVNFLAGKGLHYGIRDRDKGTLS